MKKLTTNLTIAAAALVVAVGAASAQTLTAEIPFAFRAGNQVMAPGTYRIDDLSGQTVTHVFRLSNMHSSQTAALIPQAPVDPKKAWNANGNPRLAFECGSGRCALAELWAGPGSHAYTFPRPKLGKDETADLREIPMQRGKGE